MEEYQKPLLWEEKLKLEDIFKIFKRLAEITEDKIMLNKRVFLLGSYSDKKIELWNISPKEELDELKLNLNNLENVSAYLLKDFKDFLDTDLINKFYIISKLSDYILTLVESDNRGFIVGIGHVIELGIITAKKELAEKTYLFIRFGTKLTEMLSKGILKKHYLGAKAFFFESVEELIKRAIDIIR